jgi:hypothetical protein
MGLVGLLRVLWRRRIVIAIGALLAIAAAVVGIQRGAGAAPTASSLTKVLIDTPNSLVADAQARGAGTIYIRARLLANLIVDDEAKAAVAQRAGLRPSELAIVGPGAAAPPAVITPIAEQAIMVARPTQPYLVSVEVAPDLPIISIDANAPDRDQAVKLGGAAVDTLSSVAQGAPGVGGSVAIEQLGRPLITIKAAPSGKTKAVGGALALFVFWCLACVLFDSVVQRRDLRRGEWPDTHRAWGVRGRA